MLTYEVACEKIKNNGCELVSTKEDFTEINSNYPILKKCGHIEIANAKSIINKKGLYCKECSPVKRILFEKITERIKELDYQLITKEEDYKNGQTILEIKCKNGHVYNEKAIIFMGANHGTYKICPKCRGHRKTIDEFQKTIDKIHDEQYIIIDKKYNGCKKLHIFYHKSCNTFFIETPNIVSHKNFACPKCSKTRRKTDYEFKNEVYNLYGEEYEVIERYEGNKQRIKIKHNICGNILFTKPNSFLSRYKPCTFCNSSVGEKIIQDILTKNNIENIPQYKFDNCKNINKLPFDFAIFKGNALYCLLEYHGIQHYEKIDWFENEKYGFDYRQKNDLIKKEYCENNSIKLIIIPYWEKDKINEILNEHNIIECRTEGEICYFQNL